MRCRAVFRPQRYRSFGSAGPTLTVKTVGTDGAAKRFQVRSRIDTPEELNYYKHGGILPYVLRNLAR